MTANCVLKPALVTDDLRRAAQEKTEELSAALVLAKNEWQYAVKNQDEAYQRVLQIKAEYAEWRAMTERLTEILQGKAQCGGDLDISKPHAPTPFSQIPRSNKRTAGG